ncbi:MAG: glycosyltransferase family 9 protein, partial [Rhizobiales bacterium]|nr:glycosyltransferase family 9 protein [Rhizobacter sp.]
MADHFDRILIIVTRQLGDVLLTTPLIHATRLRWPNARIDVLGFAGTLGLLRGNPDVTSLVEVTAARGWRASCQTFRRLWRRYDLALVGQPSDRAHLYGWVAAPRRSGLVTWHRGKSWWQRLLLEHAVEVPGERGHVVLEKLALLAPWAALPAVVELVPPAAKPLPDDLAARLRPGYVVVQVPSLVAYKQWPIAHYAELVGSITALGTQVVLTGSASAADRERVAAVAASVPVKALEARPPVLDVAGRLDLNQVTALLAGARLYIGPDTSITHLAAACGIPMIALYGPVDPRIFGPWPQGHAARQPWVAQAERQVDGAITLQQGSQACVPCNGAGCERHDASRSDCLISITPKRVLAQVHLVLDA